MRWLVLLFTLYALPAQADRWTTEQKVLEGAFVTAMALDYNQTLEIARIGVETNPMLGKSPSAANINKYFMSAAALHWIAADLIPSKWRTKFLYATTGFQFAFVLNNYRLGYTVSF